MSTISAALVMQLRERTSAGLMDCKKFLTAADGDIELAIIKMRKAGQAQADKKSSRVAAEGIVIIARSADNRSAVMIEINCETDFVARDVNFIEFANQTGATALSNPKVNEVQQLNDLPLNGSSKTVEMARQELVAKIGENIQLRRIIRLESEGAVGSYLHGQRIGVLVSINTADENLAKDIAMHIAASRPMVIDRSQVPADAIEKERDIFRAQAADSGKPQEIIEKMVEGRINKFLEEVSLLDQAFVKDPNKKIAQVLKEKNAQVLSFVRFEVGEGIEKKEDNFVEEVMAQARGQS